MAFAIKGDLNCPEGFQKRLAKGPTGVMESFCYSAAEAAALDAPRSGSVREATPLERALHPVPVWAAAVAVAGGVWFLFFRK